MNRQAQPGWHPRCAHQWIFGFLLFFNKLDERFALALQLCQHGVSAHFGGSQQQADFYLRWYGVAVLVLIKPSFDLRRVGFHIFGDEFAERQTITQFTFDSFPTSTTGLNQFVDLRGAGWILDFLLFDTAFSSASVTSKLFFFNSCSTV
jgi:hypothetical protein